MDAQKPIQFNATAGAYFVMTLVTFLCMYVPLFGWAYALNYVAGWHAERLRINGRPVVYQATYLESLKLVAVGAILMFVTLGIYAFWFAPKAYRYITEHMYYAEGGTVASPVAQTPAVGQPMPPQSPVSPAS
jgi:uncharacterized membrane protein YjgN (DUF898 family)